MKIVKNNGKYPKVKSKYVLVAYDEDLGGIYAKIGIKPLFGYLLFKIKKWKIS